MSNALANPLMALDPDLNLGDFSSSSVNGIDLSAINDDKPYPVVEGEDGNLYRTNAYYTPSGWKTDPDFSEPVYYYTQGVELGEAYDWRFEENEDGSITQSGSFFTESQIREFWEADEGMGYFKQEHSHMDFDTYMAFLKESSSLHMDGFLSTFQEDRYAFPEPDAEAHQALLDKYGIKTTYQNDDGDIFKFNGSNYTKTYKVDDHMDAGDYFKVGVGVLLSVYAAPALASSMSGFMSAGLAKATSSAIISQATALMNGQGLSLEDALMSAALSYGGSALGDKLGSTGAISSLTDKVNTLGNAAFNGGGAVLNAALQAGGMSLVTQLVQDGEIDWKDAAVAAAMAGGTTALSGYLSDIGRNNEEGLQEIVVTAKRVGTEVGPGLYELNGIVFSTNPGDNYGYVGEMSQIDTDGDGFLTSSDLQEITTNNQYVPSSIGYQDNNTGRNSFKEGGTYYVSEDGVVHQQSDVKYLDGGPNGTYLVKDGQGNEFYVREAEYGADGRFRTAESYYTDTNGNRYSLLDTDEFGNQLVQFDQNGRAYMTVDDGTGNLKYVDLDANSGDFVAVNGYYDAERNRVYSSIEQYTSANGITDNTGNQTVWTHGQNPYWSSDPDYKGSTYGKNASGYIVESPIYWNLEQGYYTKDATGTVVAVNPETLPEEITEQVDPEETSDKTGGNNTSSTSTNNGTSQSTSTSDSNAATTAEDFTLTQIRAIANATGTTVQSVINALDEGKSPQEILAANDSSPSTSASTSASSSDGDNSTATDTTTDKTSDGTEGTSTSGTTSTGSTTGTTPGNTAVGVTPGQEATGPTTFSVGPSVWNTGGDQSGSGTNEGEGEGEGEGDGEGDGSGLGTGGKGKGKGGNAVRGSYTPQWGPLFATNSFRKFNKDRGNGMMAPLQQNTNLSAPRADFSQSRLNLFSDLIKDLA